jgi:hypothetical protein
LVVGLLTAQFEAAERRPILISPNVSTSGVDRIRMLRWQHATMTASGATEPPPRIGTNFSPMERPTSRSGVVSGLRSIDPTEFATKAD